MAAKGKPQKKATSAAKKEASLTLESFIAEDLSKARQRAQLSQREVAARAGLTQADILEAMEGLTPMYRAVFNLYAIEEYGHREIAAELGISEGTSKSNYAKARRNLREALRRKLKAQ